MLQNIFITVLIFVFSGVFAFVFGQTPNAAINPTYYSGDVAAISQKSLMIATKTGQVESVLTEKTIYKRVPLEPFKKPDLTKATAGALADIGVGDKVTASALLAADGKSMNARTVYYFTKADITANAAKESEQWRTRGITGRVVTVNQQTNQINLELRGLTGSSNLTLTPQEKAKFLRYAPDSIRYDEAKDSSLAEIKAGDIVRALGDRSTDGTSFAAEQVVAGAIQTIAGTIKTIDVAKNEVVIKNLQTGKDVTVVVGEASVLKRFPAEMAERMAGFQMAGMGGARPVGQGGGQNQRVTPSGDGQAPGGTRPGFGGTRAGGIDDMLERLPDIKSTDLKVGDMIAISSTKSAAMDRVKAIKLVAGVEPFLRLAQATGGGQRGQGVQGGFSIPGLDGSGF